MTEKQKEIIRHMRTDGSGYKAIAARLSLSENAVKSYCRREGLAGESSAANTCRQCGAPLPAFPKIKTKKFCCAGCRQAWWNAHLHLCGKRAYYPGICAHCGETFSSYGNRTRKYCSHPCYIAARFGKGDSA